MRKFSFGGAFTKLAIFVGIMALATLAFLKIEQWMAPYGIEYDSNKEQFFFNFNLFYGLIAAFTMFGVLEKYNRVIEVTNEESSYLLNILNLSRQIENKTVRDKVTENIKRYTASIKAALWEKKHAEHEKAYFAFEEIFGLVEHMHAKDEKETMLFDHIIDQMKETSRVRAERQALLEQRITPIQWLALMMLSLGLLFVYILVEGAAGIRLGLFLALTAIFVIITFILADLDEPIGGEWGISPKPYQTVLDNIEIYETRERHPKKGR